MARVASPKRRGGVQMQRPEVSRIVAGATHSYALTSDGVVLSWWSADADLAAVEVGGLLEGLRVVDLSAGGVGSSIAPSPYAGGKLGEWGAHLGCWNILAGFGLASCVAAGR